MKMWDLGNIVSLQLEKSGEFVLREEPPLGGDISNSCFQTGVFKQKFSNSRNQTV